MTKTGFVFDEQYLQHKTFNGHPECSQRLVAIVKGLIDAGLLENMQLLKAEPADQRWIEAVHHIKYILRFEEACMWGVPDYHQDNSICRESYDIALLAVGGVLKAIDTCAVNVPTHLLMAPSASRIELLRALRSIVFQVGQEFRGFS